MEVVKRIADNVAVIDQGRIAERGTAFDIFSAPRHDATRALLAGQPGFRLPDALALQLKPHGWTGARLVLRVAFAGDDAGGPALSRVGDAVGPDFSILAGAIDEIGGRPFGSFVLALSPDGLGSAAARTGLETRGFNVEVLGHVA